MKKRIGVISLGCPKNLVDSEVMLGALDREGYEITNDDREADIIIVNTCGFIEKAKQESIDTILEMARHKSGRLKLLIVAGCLAERYREEIIREMPEVDAVAGTGSYSDIAEIIKKAEDGARPVMCGCNAGVDYLEGDRLLSTYGGYAYLKIAEGCSNCCTYCVIPSIRGPYRSRSLESIINEGRRLAGKGVKELILVAQDTTRYGTDLYGEKSLLELISGLSGLEGIEWIRLLYCYPEEVDDGLIRAFKTNPKLCRYLDMPIQHISDKILGRMGRRSSAEEIKRLLERLRKEIPGLYIRTSLIAGFPGEDEKDFGLLEEFLKQYRLDRVGVFTYSREENTPAANMKPQIDAATKKSRFERLMSLQKDISLQKNQERVGRTYRTLVEGVAEDGIFYRGRTYAEAPEIDGSVFFTSREPLQKGQFVNVSVLCADEYDITGEVYNESS